MKLAFWILLVIVAAAVLAGTAVGQSAACDPLEQVLFPPPGEPAWMHGDAIDVDGDRLVVGANLADGAVGQSGAAFSYVRDGTRWVPEKRFFARDGAVQDAFGYAVSVSGDTIAVGAVNHRVDGVRTGAVFVYVLREGGWALQAKLVGSGAVDADWFGVALDLEGDLLVVGCLVENTPASWGTAYVFRRDGGAWTQEARIEPDTFPTTHFGTSVSLAGDHVAVGAATTHATTVPSRVYVYRRDGGAWTRVERLEPSASHTGDGFGAAVALGHDLTLLVGAPGQHGETLREMGRVHVFEPGPSGWSATQAIDSPSPSHFGHFGWKLARGGELALVGQRGDTLGAFVRKGTAFVLERDEAGWWPRHELTNPLSVEPDQFGATLAVGGQHYYAGLMLDDSGLEPAYGIGEYAAATSAGAVHCDAKPNSLGCLPAIGSTGVPAFDSGLPFRLTARQVLSHRAGLLIYGANGSAALPFLGGTLCVAAPLRRTAVLDSGGATPATDCSGFLAFDFNAWIASHVDPELVPGVTVNAQFWYRDEASSFGAGLTDALEFTPCP